ncbi:MAG: hypothetical protein ABIO55_14765 [Ginsengibacter sp.]
MKISKILLVTFLSATFLYSPAQTETPKGYKKGMLVLADNNTVSGSIKDNIHSHALVSIIPEAGGKKKNYHGSDLISAEIDGVKYLCIGGDFFRIISDGRLGFLQKSSDAQGRVVYNGNEPIFLNGTDGKPGDHYIYNSSSKQLKMVSKKNINEVTALVFAGNSAAIDKAKEVNGDVAQLKDAVEIYNSNN